MPNWKGVWALCSRQRLLKHIQPAPGCTCIIFRNAAALYSTFSRVMILFFCSLGVVLAICYILGLKSLICVLFAAFWSQNLWFAYYLLHLGAKISDLRTICCVFELKSLILHAMCSISELKSQIWVAKIVNLHDNCNILVFTNFPIVFNNVWMVFIAFLIVFNDLSVVSKIL